MSGRTPTGTPATKKPSCSSPTGQGTGRPSHLRAPRRRETRQTAIARTLEAEAAPPPRKKGWSPNALQLILANPLSRSRPLERREPSRPARAVDRRRHLRESAGGPPPPKRGRLRAAPVTRPTSSSPDSTEPALVPVVKASLIGLFFNIILPVRAGELPASSR
jgi:hypothetical protein